MAKNQSSQLGGSPELRKESNIYPDKFLASTSPDHLPCECMQFRQVRDAGAQDSSSGGIPVHRYRESWRRAASLHFAFLCGR
jgi:hypothetical protein